MSSIFHSIKSYAQYLKAAQTRFYLHSPFVFELVENVFRDKRKFYIYDDVLSLRKKLSKEKTSIEVLDLGAGSLKMDSNKRKISDILKNAAIPAKYGELLFRLSEHFKPDTMLELGTSLGIGAAYLAAGHLNGKLTTMEACPNTAYLAEKHLEILKITNVKIEVGSFQSLLPNYLSKNPKLDLVYIDGHHQGEALKNYFFQLLENRAESVIFVLDDIHWSADMESAWKEICAHPEVQISVDLFRLGLIFIQPGLSKQHFSLFY